MSFGKISIYVILLVALFGSMYYFFGTATPPEPIGCRVIAHRGYWDKEGSAQNSLAALRAAQAIGVYGSEFDVNMTADDRLIVVHGPRHAEIEDVRKASLDEVRAYPLSNGEQVPTLEEYLELGKQNPDVKLILEIKSHETPERETFVVKEVLKAVKTAGVEEQTEYIAFSLHICKELARRAPKAEVAYLNGDLTPEELHDMHIDGIDYNFKKLAENPHWIKQAHFFAMSVNVWTVNKEDNMRKMITEGVDFITTDQPETAQAIINEINK